jgi:F-box-like
MESECSDESKGRPKPQQREPRGLQALPYDITVKVLRHLPTIQDLDSLSQTCRSIRNVINGEDLTLWITLSYTQPLCFPYPHGIIGACARDFATWIEGGKIEGHHSKYDHWSPPERYSAACEAIHKHGNFGLAMLMGEAVGVRLPQLR